MEAVWPITALYMGPVGLWAYFRWGKTKSPRYEELNGPTGKRSMRPGLSGGGLLRQAFKADVVSLSAFEIGLFGWMAVTQLVLFTDPHLFPDTATYWLMMQIGMVLGFMTTYPVNIWLINLGVKEAMA